MYHHRYSARIADLPAKCFLVNWSTIYVRLVAQFSQKTELKVTSPGLRFFFFLLFSKVQYEVEGYNPK